MLRLVVLSLFYVRRSNKLQKFRYKIYKNCFVYLLTPHNIVSLNNILVQAFSLVQTHYSDSIEICPVHHTKAFLRSIFRIVIRILSLGLIYLALL